jgi:predicted dehydrogenase
LDDLLGDPALDAVVLATPVFTHAALASKCLQADKLDTVEPLAVEMDTFLQACRAGAAPEDHLALAQNVVAMIETADSSLRAGGATVSTAAATVG